MKDKINIGIVEDHAIVRRGLQSMLNEHPDFHVLFDVANGQELIEVLKHKKPDILLMDVEMPVMSAHEAVDKVKKKYPKLKFVIMTAYPSDGSTIEFIKKGVNSFLNKDYTLDELVYALKQVHEKGTFFDSKVSSIIAKELASPLSKTESEHSSLSRQEIEIIKLIFTGKTSKEIADTLTLSVKTIEFHRTKILRKTGSKNVTELIKYAIQNKLIKLSTS